MTPARRSGWFSIIDATVAGYRFAGRNWRYLAMIGIVPFLAEIGSIMLVSMSVKPGSSLLGGLLMGLPSTAMGGWFMFIAARLAVFGERAEALPDNPAFVAGRSRMMWTSIIIWTLFNMGAMLAAMLMLSAARILQTGPNAAMSVVNILTIAFCFWAARLGVAHFLAAVGYPLRRYLEKTAGVGISFRLMGLGILCAMPCAITQKILTTPFLNGTGAAGIVLMAVGAAFSVIMMSVMTGACTHALKQMLGEGDRR